ncbi:MAG TPA: extracellular solute-binding protein [Clostridiales bacterium]|nr:extracellular solute-binding protein [Clostridiales bacterium]
MSQRKALTTMLALLLVVSLLASCTSTNDVSDPTPTPAVTDPDTSEDIEDGREKVGVMYTEGLPIVDPGTYSFSLFVDDANEDDNFVMFDILEEQTGVKVEVLHYPYTVAQEKLTLSLNSGDYADCIGGWTLSSNDILTLGMEEGVYIPLDDYFEKYAPKINEILDLEGVRDTMTTPDGHIYTIPYVLEAPYVPFLPYINTRWLENVGMEIPTTTEELRAVLRAFKEQDANGNGDPNDEIPFTTGPDNKNLGLLAGWFGMSVNDEGFTMVGDQLTFGATTEEYKNGIKFLAELYDEDLIDPEIFTQDSAQWKAKGGQDLYGVCIMYASSDIMPYEPGVTPDWAPLPVLRSSDDVEPVWLRNTYGSTVLKNQVVITDNAEHPEVIVRWWDNLFQLENTLQTHNGPLGVTLFKEEDGYRKIDMNTLSEEDRAKYDWGKLFPQALPRYTPAGFKILEENPIYDEKTPADKLYEPYLTQVIPSYWAKQEDAAKMAEYSTSIREYLTQKKAEWISGQADIDAEWDAYLEQLEKLNLQEFIEMRLNALN